MKNFVVRSTIKAFHQQVSTASEYSLLQQCVIKTSNWLDFILCYIINKAETIHWNRFQRDYVLFRALMGTVAGVCIASRVIKVTQIKATLHRIQCVRSPLTCDAISRTLNNHWLNNIHCLLIAKAISGLSAGLENVLLLQFHKIIV